MMEVMCAFVNGFACLSFFILLESDEKDSQSLG